MPKNINTIIANLVGIDKMKTEEMKTKLAEEKMQENGMDIAMRGRFSLASHIVRSFDSQFSLVYFSGGKCLFAGQLLRFNVHNALQYYVRKSDITGRFNLNFYNRSSRYVI